MNGELTTITILVGILHSGIRLATPYLYAAIGEMFSQRSGVLNLGVDGIMLMGAFFGFFAVFKTESLLLGILAAALIGGLMGLILCVVSITFQAEQGISGIGLFMFGLGASSLLFKTMLGTVEGIQGFSPLRFCLGDACLADIPLVGEIFFNHSLMTYGAFALVPLAWWVLNKTTWGLKVRSVGQNPEAADSLGVNVNQVRYTAVTLGGVLAGIAGASLSISLLGIFQENLTNGMGFIAVALVYFGSWKPGGVLIGALLFSTVNALQLWVQVLNLNIPSDVAVMLPYLLTIIALALPVRRSLQPAALTRPFARGEN
ncbi:MAG: ABC transporter permease [Ardenticatenaceae bacterium]|nr:ABC transporter permease [Anaerolineales bacterium]MCB9007246.1 ABC transporter permease [Ardenticatenaceae bacterium]